MRRLTTRRAASTSSSLRPVGEHAAAADLEVGGVLAGAPRAVVDGGDQDLLDVLEGAEAVDGDAVADLAGEAGVEGVDGGDDDLDVGVLDRGRD